MVLSIHHPGLVTSGTPYTLSFYYNILYKHTTSGDQYPPPWARYLWYTLHFPSTTIYYTLHTTSGAQYPLPRARYLGYTLHPPLLLQYTTVHYIQLVVPSIHHPRLVTSGTPYTLPVPLVYRFRGWAQASHRRQGFIHWLK